jgi:hypothetical protein
MKGKSSWTEERRKLQSDRMKEFHKKKLESKIDNLPQP